ncbi:MAG: DUF5703 family protein [Mycobacteriales bacterium]
MAREYEYQRVWFPHDMTRTGVRVSLSVHASYGEWELMRSRVYPDGRRYVELRRRARPGLPAFSPA